MEMERTIAMLNAARGRLKEFVRYLEFGHIQTDYGKRRKLEEMREELKGMKDQIRKRVGW